MNNRRIFLKEAAVLVAAMCAPSVLNAASLFGLSNPNQKIWASLVHVSFNMWEEFSSPNSDNINLKIRGYDPVLRFDDHLFDEMIVSAVKNGINMMVLDLGDAISYKTHPEIAVKNAWSIQKLQNVIIKLRKNGIEPIPKLNFSATHDAWLGEYHKMLSTEKYYQVCKDLIAEVIDVFDKPRFFHIGMDEETANHQRHSNYIVVRQRDAWWKDFLFYVNEVEKKGVRAWIWSDYVWNHPDVFFERMPKSVVQSNWYYGDDFSLTLTENYPKRHIYVKSYLDLNTHGYDQIPTAGYYDSGTRLTTESMMNTVKFCKENINDNLLKGFMQTSWRPTIEEFKEPILKGVELLSAAKKYYLT